MNRGILATEYATLKKEVTYEEVKAIYDKYYKDEKFVRVLPKDVCPETKWVEGSNYVDINFKIDSRTNRIIMMGAIDNLVKGAAGQAVQNMNLMFGLPEDGRIRTGSNVPIRTGANELFCRFVPERKIQTERVENIDEYKSNENRRF